MTSVSILSGSFSSLSKESFLCLSCEGTWIYFTVLGARYDYRLSYNAANNKLTKLCARIDSVKKSPHKLRKTCLSALLDNPNVNNRTVQRYAGHSDITTTLRYYDFDRSSKEEQARAINKALALEYDEE